MSGSFLGINQLYFGETLKVLTLKELVDISVHTLLLSCHFYVLMLTVKLDMSSQLAQLRIQTGNTDEEVI